MKKKTKIDKEIFPIKKMKASGTLGEAPMFHQIYQKMNNGKLVHLFKKPIFCTQRKALELGLEKCVFENNLVEIEIKPLSKEEQALKILEATEDDLMRYTR